MKKDQENHRQIARQHRAPAALAIALSCAMIAMPDAHAQTTSLSDTMRQRPIVGATTGIAVPDTSSSGVQPLRHRGPDGKVCLRVSAAARPGAGTSRLFTHWIVVENTCSTTIRLQVCYYGTRDCTDVIAGGNGRKDAILGMMPAIHDFRFEYRERF